MPMNRVNWVKPGEFYGNMWSYGAPEDTRDELMAPPLCWIDQLFDRPPSELLWVPPGTWGPLAGKLLNLSYGRGRIAIVPHEQAGGLGRRAVGRSQDDSADRAGDFAGLADGDSIHAEGGRSARR